MQPVTTTPTQVLRRPTPPAAATSMAPPPLRPPELPLPSALMPPKKRRVLRTPPKATIPFPPPPPPPVPVEESPLFPTQKPSPPPPTEKPSSPPPPPPPPTEKPPSSPPPPPPPEENPSSPPPPPAEKPSSPPPPPPPPAENPSSPPQPPPPAEKPPSPPPPPAAENSSLSPPQPSAAADEKPPTDAAAEPAPAPKARKITRKVRTIIRRVPKGTIAARKAAAESASAAARVGALQPRKGHAPDNSSRNAAVADEVVQKEQSFGGNTIEKPATDCNPTAVCETLLGKGTAVCETLLGKGTVRGGTLASGPATDIGGEHEKEKKLGSRGEDRAEVVMSERERRRMTEVFVGGLNRDAKEEDVRAALSVVGDIMEVRMIMDATTKKNKGYCFVRYRESAQARKAIAKFSNVEICGKKCRVAALDGNDKIFLGNIDKKWKKEDIVKLLQKIGVENIDVVTLLDDSNNPGYNRGFAFLELETYRDAQIAYKKLSRKEVFGKGLNITVAWAEPLNAPDENQMQKVKAVFVEGVPNSWDQAKLTEIFKKYGRVELVALSRDMHRAKRNDFALVHYTTHEAAILCLESFDGEQLTENCSKVDIRVSLAKSVQKGKKNMEDHKFCFRQKDETTAKSEKILGSSSLHILHSSSRAVPVSGYKKSSTNHGFVQVLRELAPWRHEHTGSGSLTQNYPRILSGGKRPFSSLGIDSYCMSRPHRGHERNTYATPTSSVSPPAITRYSPPYDHESRRCLPDSDSDEASLFSQTWDVT